MRRALFSSVQLVRPAPVHAAFLSTTAVLFQRGGQGRGGVARYGNSGPGVREQHLPHGGRGGRSDGYGSRSPGRDQPQQSSPSQPQGYENHQQFSRGRGRGAHDGRRRDYGDRHQGSDDGQRGSGGRGRGRPSGDRGPRRTAVDYLQRDAETLLQMKQAFKQSKTSKERRVITTEARQLLRRVRVDPSTQDERSVIVVLNCAVIFKAGVSEGLVGASQWAQANLRALSAHNIALYMNALGVIAFDDATELCRRVAATVLRAAVQEMTPVEVVMVLQAFQRLSITDPPEMLDALLLQLEPCVASMPVPQLSTLASVLASHGLRERDAARWRKVVQAVLDRALASVDTMHSKEALLFFREAVQLEISVEQVCGLARRLTATSGFHDHHQVADLLRGLTRLQRAFPDPPAELVEATTALKHALAQRTEKVARFAPMGPAASVLQCAHLTQTELPPAVVEALCQSAMRSLSYRRTPFHVVARFAKALAVVRVADPALLDVLVKYLLGERPPRPTHDSGAASHDADDDGGEEEQEGVRGEQREAVFVGAFDHINLARLHLERAYAFQERTPPEGLTVTIPAALLQHVPQARPRGSLSAVFDNSMSQSDGRYRNVAFEAALCAAVLRDLQETPERYRGAVSPAFVAGFVKHLQGTEKGKEIAAALQKAYE